jgi:hypothetical protein
VHGDGCPSGRERSGSILDSLRSRTGLAFCGIIAEYNDVPVLASEFNQLRRGCSKAKVSHGLEGIRPRRCIGLQRHSSRVSSRVGRFRVFPVIRNSGFLGQ